MEMSPGRFMILGALWESPAHPSQLSKNDTLKLEGLLVTGLYPRGHVWHLPSSQCAHVTTCSGGVGRAHHRVSVSG